MLDANFKVDQTGDVRVWVRTTDEVNGVFGLGSRTIFTGPIDECCRRALAVVPENGNPEVWCDTGEILKHRSQFAEVLARV